MKFKIINLNIHFKSLSQKDNERRYLLKGLCVELGVFKYFSFYFKYSNYRFNILKKIPHQPKIAINL